MDVYKSKSLEKVFRGIVLSRFGKPRWEYKIDLEAIVSSIGRIKTEQAVEVLSSLLNSRWGFKRGVYFYMKMAGDYDMMESNYAEPVVMSWIIRAFDKEYLVKLFHEGSKIPETVAREAQERLGKSALVQH